MGQAIISPEPLDETTSSTSSIASADDLLSQLAGEEIDRLLAESEAERAAASGAAASGASAPAAPAGIAADIGPTPTHDEEPQAQGDDDASLRSALTAIVARSDDAVLAAAKSNAGPAEANVSLIATEAPVVRPSTPAGEATPTPTSAPAVDLDVDATAAAERAALNEPVLGDTVAEVEDVPGQAIDAPDASPAPPAPLPMYLRPLEWLNAPLASSPECVREALGKVAIITLVNAIAVLVYVIVFRKS